MRCDAACVARLAARIRVEVGRGSRGWKGTLVTEGWVEDAGTRINRFTGILGPCHRDGR